jgi:hypothetical protein
VLVPAVNFDRISVARDLLCGDSRSLDDRPPLLDLGLLVGTKRLRRELILLRDYLTEIDEALTYSRIVQGVSDRPVEFADDVPQCPLSPSYSLKLPR